MFFQNKYLFDQNFEHRFKHIKVVDKSLVLQGLGLSLYFYSDGSARFWRRDLFSFELERVKELLLDSILSATSTLGNSNTGQ